jgi:hypothetical protein
MKVGSCYCSVVYLCGGPLASVALEGCVLQRERERACESAVHTVVCVGVAMPADEV